MTTATIDFNDMQSIVLDAAKIVDEGVIRSVGTFSDTYRRLRDGGHDAAYSSAVMMVTLGMHRQINSVLLRASAGHGAALRAEKEMFGDKLKMGKSILLGADNDDAPGDPDVANDKWVEQISDAADAIAAKLRDTADWRRQLKGNKIEVRRNARAADELEALAAQADDVKNFDGDMLMIYYQIWENGDANLLAQEEKQTLSDIGYRALFDGPNEFLAHILDVAAPASAAA